MTLILIVLGFWQKKGSKGMVSDVFIGTNYHDVVRPNKLQVVEKEGQSQTVLSWKKRKASFVGPDFRWNFIFTTL